MLKQAINDMFLNFDITNDKKAIFYYEKLKESGIDEQFIVNSINNLIYTWKPEYGRKLPSIAEIIGVNKEAQNTADYEQAWQEFKKTCCNNYKFEPIPDWVFTMKKHIGVYEVEEMTEESEKWVKKEFLRIIPSLRSGNLQMLREGVVYEQIGNTTILLEEKNKLINEKYLMLEEKNKKVGKDNGTN